MEKCISYPQWLGMRRDCLDFLSRGFTHHQYAVDLSLRGQQRQPSTREPVPSARGRASMKPEPGDLWRSPGNREKHKAELKHSNIIMDQRSGQARPRSYHSRKRLHRGVTRIRVVHEQVLFFSQTARIRPRNSASSGSKP